MKLLNYIRKFKFSFSLYNLFQKGRLKHNLPLYKKYGIGKNYYHNISSRDFKNISAARPKYDELESSIEMPKSSTFQSLSAEEKDAVLNWSRDGFAYIKNFLSPERADKINAEVQSLIDAKKAHFRYAGKKMMFLYRKSTLINEAALDNKLMKILELLLDKELRLFQSINFIHGSEQRTHSDSIHMSTFPPGNMIAAWVALEDTDDQNGPLHYYPGSHKLPYIDNSHFDNYGTPLRLGNKTNRDYEDFIANLIREKGLKKKILHAEKGDVFIWHANLLHGGEAMMHPENTRKSMVFHYFAEDAIKYHEFTQRPALIPRTVHH